MAEKSNTSSVTNRLGGGTVMLAVLSLITGIAGVLLSQVWLGAIAVGVVTALIVAAVVPPRTAVTVVDSTPAEVEQPQPEMPEYRVPPSLDAEGILHLLADAVAPVGQAVAAHMWLEDPSSATLRLVASVGPMGPAPQPLSLDDEILGKSVRDGAAVLAPLARIQTAGAERVIWRFAVPLSPGKAHGVVGVDVSVTEEDPNGMRLATLTAPLRGALAGSLALHVAKIETEMATALIEVARDLSRRLDPEEVLTVALETAMRISEAATGSIMLTNPETGRLGIVKAEGLPAEVVRETSLGEGEGIAGWVLATGQPLLIEDLPARPKSGRRHGVRSAVSVPIADAYGTLGVINVGSRGFPARFTESHMHALETLGKQTAIALRNAHAVASSRELYFDTLKALALAMETKDPYSRGGTERVLSYATAIGDAFGLADDQRDALRIAALLHDIGMATNGEPVGSLNRPLSTVEVGLLKLHPQIAAEILQELPALREVVPIVYHHHEWFDGRGYGGGATGESIPLGARILAVADAYVSMTSDRPYRHAMTSAQAVAELTDKAGAQFDPTVVSVFKDVLSTGGDRAPERQRL